MKKILFSVLFLAGFAVAAEAQSYQNAIGLRLGLPNSVSFKHFLNERGAVEIYGGFRNYTYSGFYNVGVLYQQHKPIESVEGLQWYVGGGAAAYFWHYDAAFGTAGGSSSVALQGCLGLDYKFADIPLNLSIDWVPTIFLTGYYSNNRFAPDYGALSARYVFGGGGK